MITLEGFCWISKKEEKRIVTFSEPMEQNLIWKEFWPVMIP